MATPLLQQISDITSLQEGDADALIIIGSTFSSLSAPLAEAIAAAQAHDKRVGQSAQLLISDHAPGQRLIVAPTGPLDRDYDDVRRFYDAARKGIRIAQQAGATKPAVWVVDVPATSEFNNAEAVSFFGLCQELYEPLEAREHFGDEAIETIEKVTFVSGQLDVGYLLAVEEGRRAGRDLCGTEPERMAPIRFAEYCKNMFLGTDVKVTVIDDRMQLEHEYPLLAAVGRASFSTPRQRPCVIRLEYTGSGEITDSLFMVGKAITYDTGGADLKTGGHMAGMSRDKGGAAGVAGFVKAVAELKPNNLKVVAEIGAARNSIGSDAFVSDEIITSHAGVRVRIGNTDAEGRLVMADCLSHLREEALQAVNPSLYTVATLTGHAALSKGPYTALVPNTQAQSNGVISGLLQASELWGDPAELSPSRREDFDFVQGRTKADDVLSSNNGPSAMTKRGHQFPMAFLTISAGLDKHGKNSQQPLPYIHLDIAGSGVDTGDWQHGKPTSTPVLALAGHFLARH
ncbi:M17 family metallopeptidase [Aliidiomarina soli]|uniref:Peptidase M17 n=1 Tax=Aliidiomarina soli TaxID=1928574 RepID=A0A432WKZ4_9GAMM|nr:leucyl aminopeptidase family protein [Aliidiomarina soli]RUO34463.1 peptidase M17 [Aliidiomarina soli]